MDEWSSVPDNEVAESSMTTASDADGSWPLARALAWVILALMAVATAYTGWIALVNFHRIGV